MHKSIITTAVSAALLSGVAFNANAATDEPQGMYSADDIMDADVYLEGDTNEDIGDVDDILLNEDMQVSALVVESGSILGLGGREIVVDTDYFSLETDTDGDDTEHRVLISASEEEVKSFPTYDRDWWEQTKANARDAWQSTEEGVQSAWQTTREAIDPDEEINEE
ncbi:PRC-barrel domain-containing protein [Halomonas sp. SH5A2]|uniref:PRC-barrel domain-containing protein n=1 Tax=Halomonas sp. SH5A2 TaxID=2749040 RepID=UPI00163F1EE0|nr:PRC-barrel domain-containing protein [Halomonas sp. SH5A2]QNI03716.1 PRC-barrel domain-containing protein [Halomonas sp. SH5A2]